MEVMKDIFLKLTVQCRENFHNTRYDLPFFPEIMKIEKVEKLVAKLHDKDEYVLHITNLKQALNHGLVLKRVHK